MWLIFGATNNDGEDPFNKAVSIMRVSALRLTLAPITATAEGTNHTTL